MDHFWFDTALHRFIYDRIHDFTPSDDTIDLDQSIFSAIAAEGVLAAEAFRVGTSAQDADDRIIYNSANGELLYDADGNGSTLAVIFAVIGTNLSVTNSDFVIHP